MPPIDEIWTRLSDVFSVRFTSQSRTGIGWQGEGSGVVKVAAPSPNVLIFEESGSWRQSGGTKMRFTNVFRWTKTGHSLQLEHLRFGPDKPVFLFEMQWGDDGLWREISPHLCKQDCYSAILHLEKERLLLNWTVLGPTRDESMSYVYF